MIKSPVNSALTILTVAMTILAGCQTTNLAARRPIKAEPAQVEALKPGACGKLNTQRSACEDAVGCYWDYEASNCAAH
jgi:hypothetical protein